MKVNTESVIPLLMEFYCNLTWELFVLPRIQTHRRTAQMNFHNHFVSLKQHILMYFDDLIKQPK